MSIAGVQWKSGSMKVLLKHEMVDYVEATGERNRFVLRLKPQYAWTQGNVPDCVHTREFTGASIALHALKREVRPH